jgi:glycosyltransferase involved in cell wall biosynthesis
MRIVLDCRSVFSGMGGIGRATAGLAPALARAVAPHEILLLRGARDTQLPIAAGPNVRDVPANAAMIDPLFEQVTLPGLLDELEADVYHGTCFSVPIGVRAARVATVHDVVFRQRPELVEPGLRAYLDRWTEVSCEVAEAVVTDSEFSRREIASAYGRLADVVPIAVDERFFAAPRLIARDPFVLYVGSFEPKKNVRELLTAFARLVSRRLDLRHALVLAGSGPLDVAAIARELGIGERVHVAGHVPDDELVKLYSAADGFAYLSEYEGFGLPPLEAMAAGTPALVSDRTSLPEVTGGGALVVDPHDPESVAKALERLLTDRELRSELRTTGREAARRFSWEASARALAGIYERVAGRVPA